MDGDAISYLRLSRKLSAAVVLASFAYLALGLLSLLLGSYEIHMHFMGMGVVTFAAGVNISFWTSLTREGGSSLAVLSHAIALLALPLASLLELGSYFLPLVPITGLLFLFFLRRKSITFLLEVYSFLSFLLVSLNRYESSVMFFLNLVWGYPVPLIYAVSSHALPKTYRSEVSKPLMLVAILTHLAALLGIGPFKHSMWLSMFSYLGAVRLDRAISGLKEVAKEALPAHRYLIASYLLTVPLLMISWFYPSEALDILHVLLIGFVGLHIYAHAPLMVPVLLGIRNSRRFNYSTLILLLLTALSWPLNRDVSLYFLAGSLFLAFYIVKP